MESRSLRISQIFQQLIDLLLRVVLEPDDVIINTPPTFGMYAFDCSINGTFLFLESFFGLKPWQLEKWLMFLGWKPRVSDLIYLVLSQQLKNTSRKCCF